MLTIRTCTEVNEQLVYHDDESGLAMVAMDFIKGQSFYEQKRSPDNRELRQVLEQAARINKVPHHPEFLFDSWAITNLVAGYEPVRKHIKAEDRVVVERIIKDLKAIDIVALPHCFVHGDIVKSNTLQGDDGKIYIVDFSVANWYPRIQELAVIAGNLLNDKTRTETLLELLEKIVTGYVRAGGELMQAEAYALPAFTRASYAAEFTGAMREKFLNGNDSDETTYWMELGQAGLRRAYS